MGRRPPIVTISAGGLIAAGLWLALSGLGVPLLTLSQLWPIIPAVGGAALLVQNRHQARQSAGLILGGTMALLSGLFLMLFSFRVGNLTWADMAGWWPTFLLIGGLSFLAVYLAEGMREPSLLTLTHILGGFGLLALPFTLGIIRGAVFNQVARLWPLVLILIGLAVVLRLRSRRRGLHLSDGSPGSSIRSLAGED